MKLLTLTLILFTSCSQPRFAVAKAKFTINGGRIKIEPLERYKPIGDTVIIVNVIKRIR